MLASVIMPVLNGMPYIKESIASLREQTLGDIEILAVDSGSTDGTEEFLRLCAAEDARVKYIHSDIKSFGYQCNIALSCAEGEYIAFCNQDDLLERDALRIWYDAAQTHPELDCIRSDMRFFTDCKYGRLGLRRGFLHGQNKCLYGKPIYVPALPFIFETDDTHLNGFYKKEFLDEYNICFNGQAMGAAAQDIGFMMQVLIYAKSIMYLPRTLYHFRTDVFRKPREETRIIIEESQFVLHIVEQCPNSIYPYLPTIFKRIIDPLYGDIGRDVFYFKELSYQKQLKNFREYIVNYITNLPENQQLLLTSIEKLRIFLYSLDAFQRSAVVAYESYIKSFYTLYKLFESSECVVVFGTGHQEENLCLLLRTNEYEGRLRVCGDKTAKMETELWGLHCESVETTVRENPFALYLISNTNHVNQKLMRLLKLGISEEQIIITPHTSVGEAMRTDMRIYEKFASAN